MVTRFEGSDKSKVAETYTYTYDHDTEDTTLNGLLTSVTLTRTVGTGGPETVRSVDYTYYSDDEPVGHVNGLPRDLKTVVLKDGVGGVIDTNYYRYYLNSTGTGYAHGLKYAFGPQAFGQLTGTLGSEYDQTDIDSIADEDAAPYADHYLEYNSDHQVSLHRVSGSGCSICSGGQGDYGYEYDVNTDATAYGGMNVWRFKTTETLPDGTHNIYYLNGSGQVMLKVFSDGASQWKTAYQYDDVGRLTRMAAPSAVSGFSEADADLLNNVGGAYGYLSDTTGLVSTYSYATTTAKNDLSGMAFFDDSEDSDPLSGSIDVKGFLSGTSIQQGETGASIRQSVQVYEQRVTDAGTFYFPSRVGEYREPISWAKTGFMATPLVTTMAYTWQGDTARPATITVVAPPAAAGQNGPGVATSTATAYDAEGRPSLMRDADNFVTYTTYDAATGAVASQTTDADTSTLTAPLLESTGGTHLNLTTTYEVDNQGRTTKMTAPNGRVDYTVYKDTDHAVYSYPGWDDTGTAPVTTGPITVSRDDRAGGYSETFTLVGTPDTMDDLPHGTETFDTDNMRSLSRSYRNKAGQMTRSDSYFKLDGLTYTTGTSLGTVGVNYYETTTDYGFQKGQPNRTVSAAGTITRTVYDGLGRVSSVWMGAGTDDTVTGAWSVTNAGSMVKVRSYEYDGGGVGDSNLTKVTEYPTGTTAPRVTQTWYDWRDRAVAVKGAVESGTESTALNRPIVFTDYDNLNRPVEVRQYDGDGVGITTTGGVPVAPSDSLLRAEAITYYDDVGRVYRSETYSVNPSSGTVATTPLTTNTWYDKRGNTIRVAGPGGLATTNVYDGAGRVTTSYTSDLAYPTSDLTTSFSRLFGDGNGSGALDTADRDEFVSTFFLTTGTPGFLPQYDSDADGDVDLTDNSNYNARKGLSVGTGAANAAVTIDDGSGQRSMVRSLTVRFDGEVSIAAGAFSLGGTTPTSSALPTVTPTFTTSVGDGVTTAKLSFPSGSGVEHGSLVDGSWTLTVDRSKITIKGGGWSFAGSVAADTVLSQTDYTYDASGNVKQTATSERFHDATGLGALGTPSSGVHARVSYSGTYYDKADRPITSLDVGTNPIMGTPTAWTLPETIPARSDAVLRTDMSYDDAGRSYDVTDPMSRKTRTTYDALDRTVKTVENYVDGVVGSDNDKTTDYAYGSAGMTSLTAYTDSTHAQTTQWVYGVTTTASGIHSNDVVSETRWPDPSTGAASSTLKDVVTVNALGQTLTSTDRNGSVHTLTYDLLGRVTSDAVTTLGSGVDGSVRRIETSYDSQGNAYLVTSYNADTGGSVVNQVQRTYNGLGQLTAEYQANGGSVNTSTTPKVQYAYSEMSGGANHSRLTSMTYPNGRVLSYNYASGLDDSISRLSSLSETNGSTTVTLESYQYLGLGTVVSRNHPVVNLSYITSSSGDAADQYGGLDRFGRVVGQTWKSTGSTPTTLDSHGYTYDRNGNRLTKSDGVNSLFNETYTYDGLNQISTYAQGSSHTQSWSYDGLGNWSSLNTDGTAVSRTHNAQNEVTGVGSAATAFDANGNMKTDETGKTYTYDAWNRMVSATNGSTTATYSYDGLSRRVTETVGSTTTHLYYSAGWQVLEERLNSSTSASIQYVWSPVYIDALILRDRDTDANGTLDERLWSVQDANFNVTALINNSGAVVEKFTYDAFGLAVVRDASYVVKSGGSDYAWVYRHQGGRWSSVSGLVEFRMRNYSINLGRWSTCDPLRFKAGQNSFYIYNGNNAALNTDPSGCDYHLIGGYQGGDSRFNHARIAVDTWKCTEKGFVKTGVITFEVGGGSCGSSFGGGLWGGLWLITYGLPYPFFINYPITSREGIDTSPTGTSTDQKSVITTSTSPCQDMAMLEWLRDSQTRGWDFNPGLSNCHDFVAEAIPHSTGPSGAACDARCKKCEANKDIIHPEVRSIPKELIKPNNQM